LAEQKIRGFGSFKVLGVVDCLGFFLAPALCSPRTGDFLAEQKIRGFGVFKVLGVWIASVDLSRGEAA
jgi:hypothetical protein